MEAETCTDPEVYSITRISSALPANRPNRPFPPSRSIRPDPSFAPPCLATCRLCTSCLNPLRSQPSLPLHPLRLLRVRLLRQPPRAPSRSPSQRGIATRPQPSTARSAVDQEQPQVKGCTTPRARMTSGRTSGKYRASIRFGNGRSRACSGRNQLEKSVRCSGCL